MALKEVAVFVGVLVVWFGLARFVLPALGISTCMSGACRLGPSGACPAPESRSTLDPPGTVQPVENLATPAASEAASSEEGP